MISKKDSIKKKKLDLPVRGDTSALCKKQNNLSQDNVNRTIVKNCKTESKDIKLIYNLIKYTILCGIFFSILGFVIRTVSTGKFNVGQLVSFLPGCFVGCIMLIIIKTVFSSVMTTNGSKNAKNMQAPVLCEIKGVSRQDFLDRMQKVVIPKIKFVPDKREKTIVAFFEDHIGWVVFIFILIALVSSILCSEGMRAIIIIISFVALCILANGRSKRDEKKLQNTWKTIEKEVYTSLCLQKIKFDKADAKAFFNEIKFFDPPVKRKVHFDDELNFSFDNGKINVYTGSFDSSKDYHDDMDMFLFEIPIKNFYKTPVVFTLGDKEGSSVIDFGAIDDASAAFDVSGNAQDIQYLKGKGVCEKLLNIGYSEFNDDCIWCIHASFYRDRLYIAFDIEYSLLADLENGYSKIKSYEWFYDDVAAIEQYCQQFEDL